MVRTKERRALARGLSVAPGTMLCALLLPFGTMDGTFWFVPAMDFRRCGDIFLLDAIIIVRLTQERDELNV